MTRCLSLAALAVLMQLVAGCSRNDQERFRGRTTEQVKQACDPQHQELPEECSRTFHRWRKAVLAAA